MVVFGAGASYDSKPRSTPGERDADGLPLTKDLFTERPAFGQVLSEFPELTGILSKVRNLPEGVSLEGRLAELQAQRDPFPQRHAQLAAVRYYLQKLIWQVGASWLKLCYGHTNYGTLLGQIQDWQSRSREPAALVTFNYDTLIEHAYEGVFGFDPGGASSYGSLRLDGYMREESMRLYKPHGSVNWGRHIDSSLEEVPRSGNARHKGIINWAAKVRVTDEFEIISAPTATDSRRPPALLVPALALPVDVKDAFACPPGHVELLRQAIPKVTRLVTVGWRATEPTFLELWRNRPPKPLSILVVSPNNPAETAANLAKAGITGQTTIDEAGFSQFAEEERLTQFLERRAK